jgi:hypothetical protein
MVTRFCSSPPVHLSEVFVMVPWALGEEDILITPYHQESVLLS